MGYRNVNEIEQKIGRPDNKLLQGAVMRYGALFSVYFENVDIDAGKKMEEMGYDPGLVGRCAGLIIDNDGQVPNLRDGTSASIVEKDVFPAGATTDEKEMIPVLMELAKHIMLRLKIGPQNSAQS
ncbi:MAG: hypothetical protein Q8P80_03940 [Candidatus Levybacteria bacterium]|nr:hypothetical protein [Candidatus Levybacteria bacterium]